MREVESAVGSPRSTIVIVRVSTMGVFGVERDGWFFLCAWELREKMAKEHPSLHPATHPPMLWARGCTWAMHYPYQHFFSFLLADTENAVLHFVPKRTPSPLVHSSCSFIVRSLIYQDCFLFFVCLCSVPVAVNANAPPAPLRPIPVPSLPTLPTPILAATSGIVGTREVTPES